MAHGYSWKAAALIWTLEAPAPDITQQKILIDGSTDDSERSPFLKSTLSRSQGPNIELNESICTIKT